MWTMKPVIVVILLLVPSLCDVPPEPDWGSPEKFLNEVNELRAKFAKERKIPNMYKLFWSNELAEAIGRKSDETHIYGIQWFSIDSYRNAAGVIENLLSPLQGLIGCSSVYLMGPNHWNLFCNKGLVTSNNFWLPNPGEAGSQCPPRFKGEDGLCVPVDPSKHTFWGTEEGFLEDLNYMRKKEANQLGIPNMHQLTWNDSLVEVLKSLNVDITLTPLADLCYPASNDSAWDGFAERWRLTDLPSFSAVVAAIDEAVYKELFVQKEWWQIRKMWIRGKKDSTFIEELIHPLQTSIGCMKKERKDGKKYVMTACLLGNIGQWPSDWKIDANSTKIPGSECMDGYVNDDGLCVLAPPTTSAPKPVLNVPKKTEASGAPESEQEEAESSSTTKFSYGLWIIYLFLSFF